MILIVLYALAYLLGSLPFGYLVGRANGIDITKVGSGNTGATNVYRALGKKAGLLVFVLDVAKGFLPVFVARMLLKGDPDFDTHSVCVGVTAVLGHSFSPFLKFKGGKGVATGLGVLAAIAPLVAGIGLGTFIVVLAIWRIVSLSSICACVAVIASLFASRQPLVVSSVFGLVAFFVIVRHHANIKRLLKGEEPKIKPPDKKDDDGDSS